MTHATQHAVTDTPTTGLPEPSLRPPRSRTQTELRLSRLTRRELKHYTTELFDEMEYHLFELSEQVPGSSRQIRLYEAIRVIRAHKSLLKARFYNEVVKRCITFHELSASITVLPPAQIAARIALHEQAFTPRHCLGKQLARKTQRLFAETLATLELSTQAFLGHGRIPAALLPWSATAVVSAFETAITTCGARLDRETTGIVFRLFDNLVIQNLGELYALLQLTLIDAGFYVKPAPATGHSATPDVEPPPERSDPAPAPLSSAVDRHKRRQVVALSLLQRQTDWHNTSFDELTGSALQEKIVDAIGRKIHGKRVIDPADESMLQVVDMLFEFIASEPGLPVAVKTLIMRMRIPVLKTAILDRTFFSEKTHSARRLMNALAAIGHSLQQHRDITGNASFLKAQNVIERLLHEFHDDPAIFDILLKEIEPDAGTAASSRPANGRPGRIAHHDRREGASVVADTGCTGRRPTPAYPAVCRGGRSEHPLEIQPLAPPQQIAGKKSGPDRERLDNILFKRYTGKPMPRAVYQFITGPWKEVLARLGESHDETDPRWQHFLDIADRLVWSVEPKTTHQDQRALAKAIPELLEQLDEGLRLTPSGGTTRQHFFQVLSALHFAALKGETLHPDHTINMLWQLNGKNHKLNRIDEITLATEDPWREENAQRQAAESRLMRANHLVRLLTPGSRLEYRTAHDEVLSIRIDQKNDILKKCVLVDERHRIFARKRFPELALDLVNGVARIIGADGTAADHGEPPATPGKKQVTDR